MNGIRVFLLSLASAVLVACGGGGDDAGSGAINVVQSPPPPAGGIGAAGGTVQGPSGAQVVIPAGALSQNVAITVTQSSAGSPALPAGLIAAGQMFAFTPHGTTFAAPVTVTVPFDPALVTTGATPTLYKTTAGQAGWEAVAGATVSGNTMMAPVTSFSYLVVVTPPPPPPAVEAIDRPWRYWKFEHVTAADTVKAVEGNAKFHINGPPSPEGDLQQTTEFGHLTLFPGGRDPLASGEVFSNASGHTYWVEAEAPVRSSWPADRANTVIGANAHLIQKQSYRKNDDSATLELTISNASVYLLDPDIRREYIGGSVEMHVMVVEGSEADPFPTRNVYRWMNGAAVSHRDGWWVSHPKYRDDIWHVSRAFHADFDEYHQFVNPEALPRGFPLWTEAHFPPTGYARPGESEHTFGLLAPRHVRVDLSKVKTGQEFTVDVRLTARTLNYAAGESYAEAGLRDPVNTGGVSLSYTGLTPTNRPVLGPITITEPPPPTCSAGNDATAGILQFSKASYQAPEFQHGPPVVLVTRTGGSHGEVSAKLTFTGGTAISGTHYTATPRTIEFEDGDDVPQAVSIPLIDNDTEDGDVTVNLALTAEPGCATLGTADHAVLTILDDEVPITPPPPPTVSLGGTISGLVGQGLMFHEQITGAQVSPTAAGAYVFDYPYSQGDDYRVRILTQPSNPIQICSVSNAEGKVPGVDVSNINVTCLTPAPSGTLDQAFGEGGKVFVNDLKVGRAVVIQRSGRVVVLTEQVGTPAIAAFDASGAVDAAFGTSGRTLVRFTGGILEEAYGLAIQSDDKLIVVGRARVGNRFDMGITRYNADGSVDTSFGDQGVTMLNPMEGVVPGPGHTINVRNHFANRALVMPDGKIYLAGLVSWVADGVKNNVQFAVARLNADGSRDTSYHYGTASVSQDPDIAYSLGVQSDGKVVLAGTAANSLAVALARFKLSGGLDADDPPTAANFGPDFLGYSYLDVLNGQHPELIVLPDDTLLLAGGRYVSHPTLGNVSQIELVTTGPRGHLGRIVPTPVGPDNDLPGQLIRLDDGKLLLAAQISSAATVADFGVLRYNADLTLDTTFGSNGVVLTDFFGARDGAAALAVQSDGKIVAVGVTRNGTNDVLGLVRINP